MLNKPKLIFQAQRNKKKNINLVNKCIHYFKIAIRQAIQACPIGQNNLWTVLFKSELKGKGILSEIICNSTMLGIVVKPFKNEC